uniref:Retrovirus-related Pol polyprotein from transposon TNT 1-94 n=1 Tax=Tanacetum cinerariifolium TaxID=118510 RepID=A0A6L2NQC7_TANCI|nr:hypothetical protein [Tanacetum cinerariifolium]
MTKKYEELSTTEKIQADCDLKETNIILQRLPSDVYSLVNHYRVSTDLWERVQLLRQVLVFKQGDDLIDSINKMMSFLSTVVTCRFPTTNNQLRNSSNPRQQATIHDGKVYVQPVLRRRSSFAAGEGHMARQCPKPKRKRDATWFRDKFLLVEAQGYGEVWNEEELEFLAALRVVEAKAVLMANLSSYGSYVLFEIRPMVYDGSVIAKDTNVTSIADSEETFMLEEESRSKMILKQSDPMVFEKKVNIKPINYDELNRLSKDFG